VGHVSGGGWRWVGSTGNMCQELMTAVEAFVV